MRNFYNQPTSKIFDKMFGKGARQIQADPTLDVSKCKCCQCDKVECKGCIIGHAITATAGCCPSQDESLIFEYERPGYVGGGMECCPNEITPCCNPPTGCIDWDIPEPGADPGVDCGRPASCLDQEGNPLPNCSEGRFGLRRCCSTGKVEQPNVRFLYNYVGRYYRFDYAAAGKDVTKWPGNGRARLCSRCDPTSLDAGRPDTLGDLANETCMDYVDSAIGGSIDDPASSVDSEQPCSTSVVQFSGCQCMGDDGSPLKDTDYQGKRLSRYRKRQMEKNPAYRWMLDIMCYDNGNVVANPYYTYEETDSGPQEIPHLENGTLYNHLLGVVHCEYWWEIARCPQNPDHGEPGELQVEVYDENGQLTGYTPANTSIIAPRFWIYACSGVPFFDFELKEALQKNYISQEEYQEIVLNFVDRRTPRQDLMTKLAQGGYFDIGDWRSAANLELQNLKERTYTSDSYFGCTVSSCSKTDFLGPVRKKFWQDSINVEDLSIPGRLDPTKARPNTVSFTPSSAIEQIVNERTDPTLKSLQLSSDCLKDPWNGDYPSAPGESATQEEIQEYEDFLAWKDAQWIYMHAKPGGWDYVCGGYANPTSPDPTIKIPDLPRRVNNTGNAVGGCLQGLIGYPQKTSVFEGGCPDIICGTIVDDVYVPFPVVGCVEASCLSVSCADTSRCTSYPEKGGGPTPCEGFAFSANCDGIRFIYYTTKFKSQSDGTGEDIGYMTCDRTVNSYLYKVNRTKGNYDEFCPHQCRTLSVPQTIANEIPVIYSNRASHNEICDAIKRGQPAQQCNGLFCFGSYEQEGPTEIGCCGKVQAPPASKDPPNDSTHPALNRTACPITPGPGNIYDGQFGQVAPPYGGVGCCWKCPIPGEVGQIECLGLLSEIDCNAQSTPTTITRWKSQINDPNVCCAIGDDCGCAENLESCSGSGPG
jgi:hypothetical protein